MGEIRKAAECVGREAAETMFRNQMAAARETGTVITPQLVLVIRDGLGLPTEGV
jgi:hypothetical protein